MEGGSTQVRPPKAKDARRADITARVPWAPVSSWTTSEYGVEGKGEGEDTSDVVTTAGALLGATRMLEKRTG